MSRARARIVVISIVLAAGCREARPRAEPVTPLTPPAVAGCYSFTDSAGGPLDSTSAFWSAPIQLDTSLAFVDGDGADTLRPGVFAVRPTAIIPRAQALDTAMLRSSWRLLRPDTLVVVRTTGFSGQTLWLRPAGSNFAGTMVTGGDVIDPNRPAPRMRVLGRRVPCNTRESRRSRPSA